LRWKVTTPASRRTHTTRWRGGGFCP